MDSTPRRDPTPRVVSLDPRDRLGTLGFTLEFFVITDFREFERHHADLRDHLTHRCELIADTSEYLIYGACEAPRPLASR